MWFDICSIWFCSISLAQTLIITKRNPWSKNFSVFLTVQAVSNWQICAYSPRLTHFVIFFVHRANNFYFFVNNRVTQFFFSFVTYITLLFKSPIIILLFIFFSFGNATFWNRVSPLVFLRAASETSQRFGQATRKKNKIRVNVKQSEIKIWK